MQNVCWNMFVKMRRRADLIMWRPIPGKKLWMRERFSWDLWICIRIWDLKSAEKQRINF